MQARTDERSVAGTIYLGYRVLPLVSVEAGYTYSGGATTTLSGIAPANVNALLRDTTELVRGYGDIYSLSLRYHFEPVRNVLVNPRVGYYYWQTRVRASAAGESVATTHSGGGATAGIGLAYRVWRGLEVGAGFDYFYGSHRNGATLLSGSLEWNFGTP